MCQKNQLFMHYSIFNNVTHENVYMGFKSSPSSLNKIMQILKKSLQTQVDRKELKLRELEWEKGEGVDERSKHFGDNGNNNDSPFPYYLNLLFLFLTSTIL